MNCFYVYGYKREKASGNGPVGSYFYIGKGTGDRAWSKNRRFKPPKNKENIEIICKDMSEDDAFQLEISLIAKYGRIDRGTGCLHNHTDGGDGVSGLVLSDETKAKMSVSHSGVNNHFYGKTHSDETKTAMKKAWDDAGLRSKISAANKGKKRTPEQNAANSARMKQTWVSRRNKSETLSLLCLEENQTGNHPSSNISIPTEMIPSAMENSTVASSPLAA